MNDLERLATEARRGADYDARTTLELVELMNREDALVAPAVAAAAPALAAAIEAIASRLGDGGRLVYAGAGTSGAIAALDAAECCSTFGTASDLVVALAAEEASEDDADSGARAVAEAGVTGADAVVALSASGRTPYTLGVLRAASAAGALTVAVTAVPGSELGRRADHEIVTEVGPEFLAGSTRLKAGTAQKLVLNAISTISMIRLGKTFGDLMVGVAPANEKLRERGRRVVRLATGASPSDAERAFEDAGGDARVAIVALLAGVDAETARSRLREAGGNVRAALS